jgi:enterochelin esterase family protein
MITRTSLISPRVAALRQALEAGETDALEAFWAQVTQHGTPLIEPIDGDNQRSLVTFLWRAERPLRNVVVIGGPAGEDVANGLMERLLDTDLWYKSYRVRNDTRTTYFFSPDDPLVRMGDDQWQELWAARVAGGHLRIDPLNPASLWGEESILSLPGAPPEPYLLARPGIPAGQVEEHRVDSAILGNQRTVWVYTPPAYGAGDAPYGWLLLFDGDGYLGVGLPTMLDNLIAEGRIPPLVAILVANVSHKDRAYELCCNPRFAEFLTQELLPWARQRYTISADPRRAILGGASYGGLAAAYMALRHPDLFGNVLAQSGAFYWRQGQDRDPDPGEDLEWGWLIRQFIAAGRLPLRFHLDVGIYETDLEPWGASTNMVSTCRHLRDVLRARGYPVQYIEYAGAHDFIGWRGTLPDALVALV